MVNRGFIGKLVHYYIGTFKFRDYDNNESNLPGGTPGGM